MRLSSCWGAEGAPPLTASPGARRLSPSGKGSPCPKLLCAPCHVLATPPYTKNRVTLGPPWAAPLPSSPWALTPGSPLSSSPYDTSQQGYMDWTFMSTHFWDENPNGTWTLWLENKGDAYNTGGCPGPRGSQPRSPRSPTACLVLPLLSSSLISNLASPLPAPPGRGGWPEPPFSAEPCVFALRVSPASTQPGRGHCLPSSVWPQVFQPRFHQLVDPKPWRVGRRPLSAPSAAPPCPQVC